MRFVPIRNLCSGLIGLFYLLSFLPIIFLTSLKSWRSFARWFCNRFLRSGSRSLIRSRFVLRIFHAVTSTAFITTVSLARSIADKNELHVLGLASAHSAYTGQFVHSRFRTSHSISLSWVIIPNRPFCMVPVSPPTQ